MKKNLRNKIALIIAVLLICLYGIFGIPSGISGKALLNAMSSRIHMGLDLQGGAHLILQVQVSEAVNAETDNTRAGDSAGSEEGQPDVLPGVSSPIRTSRT